MKITRVVLTCEHGGNRVPARYAALFRGRSARAALDSHRGYDIGSLALAQALARRLNVPLIHSSVTRLLVEPNRSPGHGQLFSEFSVGLERDERQRLLDRYYHPYRDRVETAVRESLRQGRFVLHLSVHTFTPRLRGETRNVDVGLLYDPKRGAERRFCAEWKEVLRRTDTGLRIRRNFPYRGANDGLTTTLRRRFGPAQYLGIEVEVNQGLLDGEARARRRVTRAVGESLAELIAPA